MKKSIKCLLFLFLIICTFFITSCADNVSDETIKRKEAHNTIKQYKDEAILSLADYKKEDYINSIILATNDASEYLSYCHKNENFQLVIDWHKNVILIICTDQIYQSVNEEYNNCMKDIQSAERTILYEKNFIDQYKASYDSDLRAYKAELERQFGIAPGFLINEFQKNYESTLSYYQNYLEKTQKEYEILLNSIPSYENSLNEIANIYLTLEYNF